MEPFSADGKCVFNFLENRTNLSIFEPRMPEIQKKIIFTLFPWRNVNIFPEIGETAGFKNSKRIFLSRMARGHQKIQSQAKAAEKSAKIKKQQGHSANEQKKAAQKALVHVCAVCKVSPSSKDH